MREPIVINAETREITVPETERAFGVAGERKVEVKHIRIEGRTVDGTDLTQGFTWKVSCENAGKELCADLIDGIVADAGMTLYTVGAKKEIPGFKNYISIDGGMPDNPRYALYQSEYTVCVANRMNEKADYECTVAGRCCESGDLIQENIQMPMAQRGDLIAVLTTGAYNFTMSSNYNRLCRPALVMLHEGKARLAVRRQTFEDLVACDL